MATLIQRLLLNPAANVVDDLGADLDDVEGVEHGEGGRGPRHGWRWRSRGRGQGSL